MKNRKPQVGMLAIVLFVLVISVSGTAIAQTGEQLAPALKTEEPPPRSCGRDARRKQHADHTRGAAEYGEEAPAAVRRVPGLWSGLDQSRRDKRGR